MRRKEFLYPQSLRQFSLWKHVSQAPVDPTVGPRESFEKSKNPQKVLLGQGTYRDDHGKPFTLDSVKKAQQIILDQDLDHESPGFEGIASFRQRCIELAYGPYHQAIQQNRIYSCQGISGTGSLRIGMEFLRACYPNKKAKVFIPDPTWPFHYPIAENAGFEWQNYRYYDRNKRCFNLEGMLEDLDKAEDEQIVLLHVCAHNPTGCDPTKEQWSKILEVMKRKRHFAAFDGAYQGFASGDPDQDAYSVRLFAENYDRLFLAQSFSKSFGLYGQRAGCLSFVTSSENEINQIKSHVQPIVLDMYSYPPIYPARIVDTILSDPHLTESWKQDLIKMSNRITDMRAQLVYHLQRNGTQFDWSHITSQIGMFAFTGFRPEQVEELAQAHHVFMTRDGRISVAGLNQRNVQYVADAFHVVSQNSGLGHEKQLPSWSHGMKQDDAASPSLAI